MKLILEKWQKFIKENEFSSDVPDFRDTFDNMNQRQYAAMERRYGRDLKKVGLDFEDYKRFSQVMMVKRDKYIPIDDLPFVIFDNWNIRVLLSPF